MKYFTAFLLFAVFSCTSKHPEVKIDPLSKSFILDQILSKAKEEQITLFFMYPEFCGMCTEEMVEFINEFSLKGYNTKVVITLENELTQKLTVPGSNILPADLSELEHHGLAFATGHLFLIENERFIYSSPVNSETFDLIKEEVSEFE